MQIVLSFVKQSGRELLLNLEDKKFLNDEFNDLSLYFLYKNAFITLQFYVIMDNKHLSEKICVLNLKKAGLFFFIKRNENNIYFKVFRQTFILFVALK